MNPIRRFVMFAFAEKWAVCDDNVRMAREIARLRYERDDALSLVADLQEDVAAVEQINQLLLRTTPSDLRAIADAYDKEAGTHGN